MKKPNRTDVLFALGLSHALMIANWLRLNDPGVGYAFFDGFRNLVIAAYALHFVFFLIFLLVISLFNRTRIVMSILLFPVVLIALDNLRVGLKLGLNVLTLVLFTAVLIVVFYAFKIRKLSMKTICSSALQIFGFIAFVSLLASSRLLFERPLIDRPVIANDIKFNRKIVVAIFDELDPVHALEKWPQNLPKNEFQKMQERAISFSNCAQPGRDTIMSIPAMFTGRFVDCSVAVGKNKLNIDWENSPNFLAELKKEIPISILGWYHPYSKIFDVPCEQYPTNNNEQVYSFWLLFSLVYSHTLGLAKVEAIPPILAKENARYHNKINQKYQSKMIPWIREHDGIIILHLPAPHSPFSLYQQSTDKNGQEINSYYQNVLYAGSRLLEIQSELKASGKKYTLIVTSDHNLRKDLNGIKPCGRVPFMIQSSENLGAKVVQRRVFGENVYHLIKQLARNKNLTYLEAAELMSKPRVLTK